LLRPARAAAEPQPCPVCDDDAERIVSQTGAIYTFREGKARRLPDDGTYSNLGKKLPKPVSHGIGRPDPFHDPKPLHMEDIEKFEIASKERANYLNQGGYAVTERLEREEKNLRKKMTTTTGTPRVEQAKRDALKADLARKRAVAEERKQLARAARAANQKIARDLPPPGVK
jgi:hypothetical protein